MSAQEKKEINALKFIKKHEPVTKMKLYSKFPFLKEDFRFISSYVSINGQVPIMDGIYESGEMQAIDSSTYTLNRNGRIFFEQRQEKFLSFWLPYGITTLIATASLLAQFLK